MDTTHDTRYLPQLILNKEGYKRVGSHSGTSACEVKLLVVAAGIKKHTKCCHARQVSIDPHECWHSSVAVSRAAVVIRFASPASAKAMIPRFPIKNAHFHHLSLLSSSKSEAPKILPNLPVGGASLMPDGGEGLCQLEDYPQHQNGRILKA